ncbi:VOC family protein [Actinomycetaceae bacterium L2_0104]
MWVSDFETANAEWSWLLDRIGFVRESEWQEGVSWSAGGAYLTITTSPNLSDELHDRRRPGVNHLAFKGGTAEQVDAIMAQACEHGWEPLCHERYPHAGGKDHYAGWLENSAGFKAEVVADLDWMIQR